MVFSENVVWVGMPSHAGSKTWFQSLLSSVSLSYHHHAINYNFMYQTLDRKWGLGGGVGWGRQDRIGDWGSDHLSFLVPSLPLPIGQAHDMGVPVLPLPFLYTPNSFIPKCHPPPQSLHHAVHALPQCEPCYPQ